MLIVHIHVQSMFNDWNEENSNFAEDWNLIGGLGDEVPQKQKLYPY